MFGYKKSCKNDFDMMLLPNSIIWHHRPKIIDQPEISGTPRASNRQHLLELKKISESIANSWGFCCFFRYFRGARGGRNFWPIDDFWPMMSYECSYKIICIYDTHIWKYDQKLEEWWENAIFWAKMCSKWYIKICHADMLKYEKSWKNGLKIILLSNSIF